MKGRLPVVAALLATLLLLGRSHRVAAQETPAPSPSAAAPGVEQVFDGLAAKMGARPAFVRLLSDNPAAWYARWKILESAEHTIDATYYIIEGDVFGQSFLGMLMKKAQSGVRVRLMVDARGTRSATFHLIGQTIFQKLAALPNVQIKIYNPLAKALKGLDADLRAWMASNHDKLLIVDDKWLITGGRNISRNYFASTQDVADAYRDTDVLMEGGDVPAQAKLAFDEEFNKTVAEPLAAAPARGDLDLDLGRRMMQSHLLGMGHPVPRSGSLMEQIQNLAADLDEVPHLTAYAAYRAWSGERAYPAMLLDKHSLRQNRRNDISSNLETLIDSAKEELVIQNAYVVLTKRSKACLQRASQRGVKIVLNTNSPDSSDSVLTQTLFVKDWKQILHEIPTLRIFAFRDRRKLHAKVFVIDRKVAVVGTYNMDTLSEEVNSEEVVAVRSGPFAMQNVLRVEEDMKSSVEYKIRVEADGTIVEVIGPAAHCDPATLDWIQRLGSLSFLRPLI